MLLLFFQIDKDIFVHRFLIYFFILFTNQLMATEEPDYSLIFKEKNLEIREYTPRINAHVKVIGSFSEASSRGFKVLADYIFGNNTLNNDSKKMSMTAPVIASPLSKNITMTAPVIAENNNNEWIITFVMPKIFTLENLPKPNNKDITITLEPKEKFAVITFSGLVKEQNYNEKINLLNQFIKEKKLKPIGSVQIARYNPPWTLPFFRRNEIMIRVD